MVQLVGYHCYQTEIISVNGNEFTVRFTKNSDNTDFAMVVSNNNTGKQSKYHYSEDVAESYKHLTG